MNRTFSITLPVVLAALAAQAEFPAPHNSEQLTGSAALPPEEAARGFEVPKGFQVGVFAAEPDVQNPIAMAWDARGRLWIAENYTYAERGVRYDLKLRDRIIILEDTNGDGRFDRRTVFADDLQMLTSIEVGLGGVWAMALPNVVFIPDRDGDDKPDGPAIVHVEGFVPPRENHHNVANGLRFGPDGWLYGRCGASGAADVNVEGRTEKFPVRGGMWRYHPQRREFETITSGNTNPWGHDWDAHGELFYINTVNGHLWHAFHGAHFARAHTIDPNPHAYGLIDHHADHWHFDTNSDWTKSRDGAANEFGGGHSHIGMMIYQGDNWPAQHRGRLFTLNQHGRRANVEILERAGSGYVGRHGGDTFIASDPWFRGLDVSTGPDGAAYVIDWSDTGECHDHTGVHRTSGRIYRVAYGDARPSTRFDLTKLNARELVKLHTHANDWFVRQARLELVRRSYEGWGLDAAKEQLPLMLREHPDSVVMLRALWTLHGIGVADDTVLRTALASSDEHLRTWAVRLRVDHLPLDTLFSTRPSAAAAVKPAELQSLVAELNGLAVSDSSGLVRLALASALQRLPVELRPALAARLVAHREDAADHNLPLLIWYGLIPVAATAPMELVTVAEACELPITRQYIARRLAEDIDTAPAGINALIAVAASRPGVFQQDIVRGLGEALSGWRKAKKPAAWDGFVKVAAPEVKDRVTELSVVFGDGRALDDVKRIALDGKSDLAARQAALQTLVENRPPDLREICTRTLGVRFLNPIAARGLAQFDDPAAGAELVGAYRKFHASDRAQLMAVLVSRPGFASALLDAVEKGQVPRADISAFHARQIRGFNDANLTAKLAKVWGEMRDGSADQQALIARLKRELTSAELAKADLAAGREMFNLACASCHRLYGHGGEIGPDLTGAGRDNLDYLLHNIAAPGAVVSADFRMSIVELEDGRILNGVVLEKSARTLTLQTMTERLTVERSEIEKLSESQMSLMPDGLLDALSPEQQRNLIAYLMHKTQVPLAGGE